jgi:nitrogen regulatory protein PII
MDRQGNYYTSGTANTDILKVRRSIMKLIKAIIRPLTLEKVKTALQDMGIDEIMVEETMVSQRVSNGFKKGETLFYRGAEYVADFMTKMDVEVIVADGLVDNVVATIRKIARMDQKGDCKICILPLIEAL